MRDVVKRVLVSGATGAIGVPLVRYLLHHGIEVCVLARQKPDLWETVRALFDERVRVLVGDVTESLCGVSSDKARSYTGLFDAFVHAAGKTQFHQELKEETYRTNKIGTANALALTTELEIPRFAFVSTCYVAGRKAYLDESECGRIEDAHNPYEASKIEAEELVRLYPGAALILRLSTVIGDAETGHVMNAGGYAAFVRGFWIARNRIRRYPDNPFWVGLNPESTFNLMTSDWVVDHIWKAVNSELVGTVHLSHPNPVSMGWLFEQSVQKLGLPLTYRRLEVERTALWHDPAWRKVQESITKEILGYFGSYVTRDTTFGHERVKLIPGYTPPISITERIIAAQINYMVNRLFSRRRHLQNIEAA